MPTVQTFGEVHPINDIGNAAQYLLTQTQLHTLYSLATSITASGTTTSSAIITGGAKAFAFGITSSQGGTVTIQRYLDEAATIVQGAAVTGTLTASTALTVNSNDGNPFQALTIEVSNSSGSTTATLTNVGLLVSSY